MQEESTKPLKESVGVLNSFLTAVVALFIFDVAIFLSYFSTAIEQSIWGRLIALVLIPLNICLYAGILGVLVELASGQEMLSTIKNFKQNAKNYWKVFLFVGILPIIVHFLIFLNFPERNIPLSLISSHLDVILACFLAQWIIRKKYLDPLHLTSRKIIVPGKDFINLLLLFSLYLGLYYLPQFIQAVNLDVSRITILLSKYFYLFIFLYLTLIILKNYPEIKNQYDSNNEVFMINPLGPGFWEGTASLFMRFYPGVFVVIKALSPKNYRFREFNRIIWQKKFCRSQKLVCVTCYTSNCSEAYKIAKDFKQRGSTVIMGGPHVTYLPDEALEFCDSVVIGEAEGVWKDVIKDYENHTLKLKYYGSARDDYHTEVHQELLNSPPEVIRDFLETSRGCKFKCRFCTIPSLSEGKTRQKPVFELVELIEKIRHKYKYVNFIDNNIYNDPGYARELFKALKPLNIKWGTQCTIDIAKNDETLRLARESGCVGFLFGYEIFGESAEQLQGGKFSMSEKYLNFSKKIKDLGITIKAHFIFGHDSDNFGNLLRLWKFCFKLYPHLTVISLLTPLPGSALYEDMLRENRLTNLNWGKYACHALVFKHKQMNNYWLAHLYPVIYVFFLLTTSRGGHIILTLLLLSIFSSQVFNV